MTTLDEDLQAALLVNDTARLVSIYQQAAFEAEDPDVAAFLLTQAYVFALEADHPEAATLRQHLIDAGREAALPPPLPPRR